MASKASVAAKRFGKHAPVPDDDAPGCCKRCPIPLDAPNDIHTLPAVDPAVREAEARRLGETD